MKSRCLTWERLYDRRVVRGAACGPVSRRLKNACLVTAAAQCGVGVLLLFAAISAIVWEGGSRIVATHLFFASGVWWFGVATFWQVSREQTAVAWGLPVEGVGTEFQPRPRSMLARLAIAVLPGVGMVFYFVQAGLKPSLVEGAGGWLLGIALGFATSVWSSRRFWLRPFNVVVGFLVLSTIANELARAFGGGFHFRLMFFAGWLVGYLPTALAFRGVVSDRLHPAKPETDSPRSS